MTYDPDAGCHYIPGACTVGGIRTNPPLLAEFRQLCETANRNYATLWLWTALIRRHPLHRLNRWCGCIVRILEE